MEQYTVTGMSCAACVAGVEKSRSTLKNIKENLFWAFFYNSIGIPLAMGVLVPLGITLNPMFGAVAMSLSSFCVVSNALRLNLLKIHDASHDKKRVHGSKDTKKVNEEAGKAEAEAGKVEVAEIETAETGKAEVGKIEIEKKKTELQ